MHSAGLHPICLGSFKQSKPTFPPSSIAIRERPIISGRTEKQFSWSLSRIMQSQNKVIVCPPRIFNSQLIISNSLLVTGDLQTSCLGVKDETVAMFRATENIITALSYLHAQELRSGCWVPCDYTLWGKLFAAISNCEPNTLKDKLHECLTC